MAVAPHVWVGHAGRGIVDEAADVAEGGMYWDGPLSDIVEVYTEGEAATSEEPAVPVELVVEATTGESVADEG